MATLLLCSCHVARTARKECMDVKRIMIATVTAMTLIVTKPIAPPLLSAASPAVAAISADSPTITWAGRTWLAPNPLSCFRVDGIRAHNRAAEE